MSKIPVGATIAGAYRFAFGTFHRIVGIMWLPWLAFIILTLVLRDPAMRLSQDIATKHFAGVGHLLFLLIPLYLFVLFVTFMQITGVTQQALGMRSGSPYYYFAFDKPVWRLIGAFLLAVLIFVGLYVAFILAGVVVGLAVAPFGKSAAGFAVVAGFLVGFAAYFYILVRLSFLLNPVVVAESRIDIARSWSLGNGNFWRMFLIGLAVLVPVMALSLLSFLFLYGGFPPAAPLHATAAQIAARDAATVAWTAAAMKRNADYWYIVYPGYGLLTALMYGLGCGAQAFAYRALVPQAPSVPVAAD